MNVPFKFEVGDTVFYPNKEEYNMGSLLINTYPFLAGKTAIVIRCLQFVHFNAYRIQFEAETKTHLIVESNLELFSKREPDWEV